MISTALINGRYEEIARTANPSRSGGEAYLAVRARIILGRYDEARSLLEELKTGKLLGEPACELLNLQLRLFCTSDTDSSIQSLMSLEEHFQNDLYLRGELCIVLGFAYSRLSKFRRALHFDLLAADHYREANLPGCLAVALFNVAVASNHLNLRETHLGAIDELSLLAKTHQSLTVQLAYLRLAGNKALDEEEFSEASRLFLKALDVCRQQKRARDFGSIAISYLYAHIRQPSANQHQTAKELEDFLKQSALLTTPHRYVLQAIKQLLDQAFFTEKEVRIWVKKWQHAGVEGVNLLFLLGIALTQLLRIEEYASILNVVHLAHRISRQHEQVLSLMDTRYFEAQAYVRLGVFSQAANIARAYLLDGLERNSPQKERHAKDLLSLIEQCGGPNYQAALEVRPLLVVLKKHSQLLCVGGKQINLRRKVILSNMIALLISKGPLDLHQLFKELYEKPYRAEFHERRMHSLTERLRSILGDRRAVERRHGKIGFASHVRAHLETEKYDVDMIAVRRKRLASLITASKRPLSISDIEAQFVGHKRRSLQLDLAYLIRSGLIKHRGEKRARVYLGVNA